MKNFKDLKNYLLAFFIPFLLLIGIFYFKDVLNDIENIYVSDLRLQHIVFLNYLKNILMGNASLTYSFNAGMGSPMLATLIFYCLSPINLLLLLIKEIRYAILFVYIAKVSLAGLTMFSLLKWKYDKNNFMTVLFSVCYALGSFAINYFFCVFWFDVLYLAPMVVLGIEKMFLNERINLLYIFSLGLAIICNIQMGFGLCVFSLVYFLYSIYINYDFKKDLKKVKRLGFIFVISSILAGGVSSGALFGFGLDYGDISVARGIEVTTRAGVANLFLILKNFLTVGNYTKEYYNDYIPFIYSGLIVSIFSILYLFNKDIKKRKRYGALIVILIFMVSFCVRFINLFWHLSSPVLLNFRYSIYLSLFLTMLAYECYINKNKLIKSDLIVISGLVLISFLMMLMFATNTYVVVSFIFILLISGGVIIVKNKNKNFKILLILLVLSEVFINGYLSIYTASNLPLGKYVSYDNLKKVNSFNKVDDSYRVMYNYSYTDFTNDTLLLNDGASLRYFSSVINGNVLKFFERLGSAVGNNNYRLSAYDSPLVLSLMGGKYFYLTHEFNNSIYEKKDEFEIESYNYNTKKMEKKKIYLYENPYALSVGYVIDSDVKYNKGDSISEYQNKIISSFLGDEVDVILDLENRLIEDSEICINSSYADCRTYVIENNTNNLFVYIYTLFYSYKMNKNNKVYIDTNKPLLLSSIDKEIEFNIEYIGSLENNKFITTTYDEGKLVSSLEKLQENMIKNVKINKNKMSGEIDSNRDGILFLSIPYDDRFKIYIDGREKEYFSVLDNSFIGVDITKGSHDLKIVYNDNRYIFYIISSFVFIIISVFVCFFGNKKLRLLDEIERIRLEEELKKREEKNNKKKEKKKKKR